MSLKNENVYSLEEIIAFLDDVYGRSVDITDYFPDVDKFIQFVKKIQKVVGFYILDDKKQYRLKKQNSFKGVI